MNNHRKIFTISKRNYSLVAGQYFDIKIEHENLTKEEFEKRMSDYEERLTTLFGESNDLQKNISR